MAATDQITNLVAQLGRQIDRLGRALTYTAPGPGASTAFKGWAGVMNLSAMYPRFTSAETSTWARPAYTVTIAGAASWAAVNGTIPIDGVTYTVKKIERPQIAGVVVYTRLFVAA